jgi:tetratricopeptide (TPR) repeat protein
VILAVQTRANTILRAANEAERLASERARGRLRLAMDAVRTYHTGVSEDVLLRQPEMKSIQSRLLQAPLAFYEDLRADLESDRDTTTEDRRSLADAYVNLAGLTERIGSHADAEAALLKAAGIYQQLADRPPSSAADRAALARVWRLLGAGSTLMSKYDQAEDYLTRAVRAFHNLDSPGPGVPQVGAELGAALIQIGTLYSNSGRFGPARDSFAEAQAVLRRASNSGEGSFEADTLLIKALNNAGLLFNTLQEPAAAERALRECVELADLLAAKDPARLESRDMQANGLMNLGFHLGKMNRFGEAEAVVDRAKSILSALTREMPAVASWQGLLGTTENTMATIYQATGRLREAEASYRRALEVYKRLEQSYPDEPRYTTRAGAIQLNLGMLAAEGNNSDTGLRLLGEAVATLERVLAAQPQDAMARTFLQAALRARAEKLGLLGRHPEAMSDWDRAYPLAPSPEVRSQRGFGNLNGLEKV